MKKPLDCIDDDFGDRLDCDGPVELRPSLTGTSTPIARCEKHWGERLNREDQYRELDGPSPPRWFDPAYAGEAW